MLRTCIVCLSSLEFIVTSCLNTCSNIDRYMAPEVFKHRKYDKKVDIFSFAMILYEVVLPSKLTIQKPVISYDHACSE